MPCSPSTWTLWLDPTPRIKRPAERWSSVAADIAMVGTVRTKTLVMLVPKRIREVWAAQAANTANWSPPCPSATHADSYPSASASLTHSTISAGLGPPENAIPILLILNLRAACRRRDRHSQFHR